MTKKIFRSITVVAMTVLLAGLLLATTFLHSYFNQSQVNQLKEELSLVAKSVDDVGIEYFDNFDSSLFRFTVISPDGTVLYDSQVDEKEMDNHLEREEIVEALKDGKGSSARYSSTLTERTFYEATRLENGDVLRVSINQVTVGALILGMIPAVCAIVLVSIVVAIIMSNKMATSIVKPLNELDLDQPTNNNSYETQTMFNKNIQKQLLSNNSLFTLNNVNISMDSFHDNTLIKEYLHYFFYNKLATVETFNKYLEEKFLQKQYFIASVLRGDDIKYDQQLHGSFISKEEYETLCKKIEITICKYNKTLFEINEDVVIDLDIKNVSNMSVSIYEINTENYYLQKKQPLTS